MLWFVLLTIAILYKQKAIVIFYLAPGGTVVDDGAKRSPFSIFTAEDNIGSIKKHVEVFNKLIRRYKYLQRSFEETIKNLLQYISKWSTEENNKLATAIGLFASGQMTNINVLTILFKEHLVKEGLSRNPACATIGSDCRAT